MSIEATAFESPQSLRTMRERLGADASVQWRGGDNDEWGAYLVTRLPEEVRASASSPTGTIT